MKGLESEFTRKIREKQLQQPAVTSCALCEVIAPTVSAKAGIAWFKRHKKSRQHKANLDAAAR